VVEDVGPDFSPNAQVSVLIHELSHALVRIDRRDGDPKLDYASEEVVVESVAYLVCAGLGLDSGAAPRPTSPAGPRASKAIRSRPTPS
jgi:hypothetical protein